MNDAEGRALAPFVGDEVVALEGDDVDAEEKVEEPPEVDEPAVGGDVEVGFVVIAVVVTSVGVTAVVEEGVKIEVVAVVNVTMMDVWITVLVVDSAVVLVVDTEEVVEVVGV